MSSKGCPVMIRFDQLSRELLTEAIVFQKGLAASHLKFTEGPLSRLEEKNEKIRELRHTINQKIVELTKVNWQPSEDTENIIAQVQKLKDLIEPTNDYSVVEELVELQLESVEFDRRKPAIKLLVCEIGRLLEELYKMERDVQLDLNDLRQAYGENPVANGHTGGQHSTQP